MVCCFFLSNHLSFVSSLPIVFFYIEDFQMSFLGRYLVKNINEIRNSSTRELINSRTHQLYTTALCSVFPYYF